MTIAYIKILKNTDAWQILQACTYKRRGGNDLISLDSE